MPSQKIIPKDKNFSRINLEKKRFSEKIAFRPRNPTLSNVHERTVIEIDLFENSIVHLYELISPDRRPTPSQSHKSFARHRYKKRKRGKFVGKELDRQKETYMERDIKIPSQTNRDIQIEKEIHRERQRDSQTEKITRNIESKIGEQSSNRSTYREVHTDLELMQTQTNGIILAIHKVRKREIGNATTAT